jgi:hypothetical protein
MLGISLKINDCRCGIVGYCGEVPADPNILKLLLLYNMDRGEDSTGWVINNKINKDTIKVSEFLRKNALVISEDNENYTIICHARKASSGARYNKELAHPFGMYKDSTEKERYDLVLAMNGTMTNTESFCREFDMPFTQHTNSDTQMLAKIMCELGEKEYIKALEGYSGAATLLFFTPKYPNTLMVYKDPERPMFMWQKDKNQMYLSSMKEALESVAPSGAEILTFGENKLYRINKGKITKTVEVDRTNPIKIYIPPKSAKRNSSSFSSASMWEELQAVEQSPNAGKRAHDTTKHHLVKGNKIYLYCDKYYDGGHPITGKKLVNNEGIVSETLKEGFNEYFFFFGYMCKNEESYNQLFDLLGKNNSKEVDVQKFRNTKISSLCDYFTYPVTTHTDDNLKNFRWMCNKEWEKNINSEGKAEVDLFLSNCIVTIQYNKRTTKDEPKRKLFTEESVKLKEKKDEVSSALTVTGCGKVVESLKIRFPELKSKNNITSILLKNGADAWPSVNLRDMRVNCWQVNENLSVDEWYYELLFDLFASCQIAEIRELDQIHQGGVKNLKDVGFLKEVQKLTALYIKYIEALGKTTIDIDDDNVEDVNIEDVHDNFHIQAGRAPSVTLGFNNQTTLDTIRESNSFFINDNFKREFYQAEHEDLDKFKESWVSTDGNETEKESFIEAILLCLLHIGYIKEHDMMDKLNELSDLETLKEVTVLYDRYYETTVDKSRERDQSIERIPEGFDSGEFEIDVENNYNDIISSLKSHVEVITMYQQDNVISKKTIKLKEKMEKVAEIMEEVKSLSEVHV